MNPEGKIHADTWAEPSSDCDTQIQTKKQSFASYNSSQEKWDESSFPDYGIRIEDISDFNRTSKPQSLASCDVVNQNQINDWRGNQMNEASGSNKMQDWDPRAMLNNLSFLEKKIHHLQDLVHLIVGRRGQAVGLPDELLLQQQLVTADLTSIIAQLISTAGSLLPSVNHILSSTNHMSQLGHLSGTASPSPGVMGNVFPQNNFVNKPVDHSKQTDIEDQDIKSDDDVDEGENLSLGSYEILQLEKEEILAPHTHFCTICGKGFKRDANLRMHMRGHGDEYKTPAALAKPNKESSSDPILFRRYSCPFIGCKRNRDHKKFQPLKTILCVKNHYKRTHCDKTYICSRCNTKKFSVLADLKTHEKHCGRDKWLCSCGTTFSRKDKLFGHITLFQGHTPAISVTKDSSMPLDQGQNSEASNKVEQIAFNYHSNAQGGISFENMADIKGSGEDSTNYLSPSCYETGGIDGFREFPQPPFEDPEYSFSFLFSGSCDYPPKN